jgi:hypothetical protein
LLAVGHSQSADQRQSLAVLEVVSLESLADRLLRLGIEAAQLMRHGHADSAGIDPAGRFVAELLGQG